MAYNTIERPLQGHGPRVISFEYHAVCGESFRGCETFAFRPFFDSRSANGEFLTKMTGFNSSFVNYKCCADSLPVTCSSPECNKQENVLKYH